MTATTRAKNFPTHKNFELRIGRSLLPYFVFAFVISFSPGESIVGEKMDFAEGSASSVSNSKAGKPSRPINHPIQLTEGPHLFVDDYLIESSQNVARRVNSPERDRVEPIVTSGPGFFAFQPYLTVLYDSKRRIYRMWYNADARKNGDRSQDYAGPDQGYLESSDGIYWPGPFQRISLEVTYGAAVIDEGSAYANPNERYKQVYTRVPLPVRNVVETRVAYSADGLTWTDYANNPILPSDGQWGDILNVFYDPVHLQYRLFVKRFEWFPYQWTDVDGQQHDAGVRLAGTIASSDFVDWTDDPQLVFAPDEGDQGITQFYGGPAAVMKRGDLWIGMLKVLRDDLIVEGAPASAYGYGYTVLTWSRDGIHWERDRAPNIFLAPDPTVGVWDHAHAWIDEAINVKDEIYLYYGGYRWGHKYNDLEDRQIGLVRMEVDRYVAREAGEVPGLLQTKLLEYDADLLILNADASQGKIEFQMLDVQGIPIPGFTFADCRAITVDSSRNFVQCKRSFNDYKNVPVYFQFLLEQAKLYALSLVKLSDYSRCGLPNASACFECPGNKQCKN